MNLTESQLKELDEAMAIFFAWMDEKIEEQHLYYRNDNYDD